MGTTKEPLPTMPYACTTQYMVRTNKPTDPQKTIMIPQEEVNILNTLTRRWLTCLSSIPVVTDGQYKFKVMFPPIKYQQFANAIINQETLSAIKYGQIIQYAQYEKFWNHSFTNELGSFSRGVGKIFKETDTIFFVNYYNIPSEHHKAYVCIVVDYHPPKDETNHTCLIVGENLIDYPRDMSIRTYETTTAKTIWNSVISAAKAK